MTDCREYSGVRIEEMVDGRRLIPESLKYFLQIIEHFAKLGLRKKQILNILFPGGNNGLRSGKDNSS